MTMQKSPTSQLDPFEAENIECKTQFQLDKTFERKLWETDFVPYPVMHNP